MAEDEDFFDESRSAKFNAGVLMTQRLHTTLSLINFCKSNLEAFNSELGDWNFNIYFRNVNVLFGELEGFFDDEESKICIDMRNKIRDIMKKYPIVEERNDRGKKKKHLNLQNLEIITKAIEHYERIIKRYGIKYQVISAFAESSYDGL